jgi:DNA topoisomerase I
MSEVLDKEAAWEESARAAHLHYVHDDKPGITREATPGGFRYRDTRGREITDDDELTRIRKLAIPPAYRDVWICPDKRGHLQASGRDARGRKQYRYHPRWREVRDEAKYAKMLVFGEKLPLIRARVAADLARRDLGRDKVVASVVRLLEKTLARVGNEEYARENKSFGLTTLRNRHARVRGRKLVLDFRGKHGIDAHLELVDAKLANVISKLQDLRGQHLFQYEGEDGELHAVTSDDVNDYLREASGEDITAKDFRTWAATNLAALALQEFERFDSQAAAKKNVRRTVEAVAKMLGNTPSVCRKCYIHPAVFDGYLDGTLSGALAERAREELANAHDLTTAERAVTTFLAGRLEAMAA